MVCWHQRQRNVIEQMTSNRNMGYSSSASRTSVAFGCAFVPVMSSRTEITGAPSCAASRARTVDFPMPGSPSKTTNGNARKPLTRSILRSSFSLPSIT